MTDQEALKITTRTYSKKIDGGLGLTLKNELNPSSEIPGSKLTPDESVENTKEVEKKIKETTNKNKTIIIVSVISGILIIAAVLFFTRKKA